jgi:glycosyltransferase involved in cell wall biosynthesis
MRILMIGPFPPVINGVTVSNEFLYRELISKGEKVSKINTETGAIASMQGDKISISKIYTFLYIYKYLYKVFGKDVVYMAIGQTFWGLVKYTPFICLCKLFGKPYILHIHGGYVCKAYEQMNPVKKRMFKYLLHGSKSIIALSSSLAADLNNTFPNSTIEVVENFYDPRLIENSIDRAVHEQPRFLFLSNLMLGKGILNFLDALLILKKDKHLSFQVAIAGNLEKGIADTLNQKIKALGDSVYFYGVADFEQKKNLLYWSDIFVLPTWYIMEGQPLSIIEAYVTGNIVVSTHQGGIKDISNYKTFVKTEAQNSTVLANTLVDVLAQLPSIQQYLQETKDATQKRFDSARFVEEIFSILKKACRSYKLPDGKV